MRYAKLIIFIIFCLCLLDAGQVKLYGGGEKKFNKIRLKHGQFTIDGAPLSQSAVSAIVFASKAEAVEIEAPQEQFDTDMLFGIAASMTEEYPDAQGIILFDHGEKTFRSDGTQLYRYHFAGKIIQSSRLDWGTRSLYIDEGRESSKIIFARSIAPDGTALYADTSKATITPIAEDDVSFSYGSIYTLNIPGVQEGSIVEYIYEREMYNPDDTVIFSLSWYFQDEDPVYSSRILARIPKPKKLYYLFRNPPGVFGSLLYLGNPKLSKFCFQGGTRTELDGFISDQFIYADTSLGRWLDTPLEKMRAAEPRISDEDTATTYIWKFEKIPPLVEEPEMPDYGDVIPHIEATTLSSWDYIFDWLGDFQRARIELTPEIETKSLEIVEGAKTIEEKIDRLYRWCQREIQYISIKGSVSSSETGHPAAETFRAGYGDCSDKSILLSTMLKAVGVEAHPIFLMTNSDETVDRCIPDLGGNHAITLAFLPDGREVFLDATSTTDKFPYFRSDDHGVSFVDALGRDVGMIPENAPEDCLERVEVEMILNLDGSATADFKSIPFGMLESDYRGYWEWQQQERYEQIFANWMNNIFPQAELDSFALSGMDDRDEQLIEWARVSVDSFPAIAGDMWILTIPVIARSMSGFEEINLDNRKFDIEYTCPFAEEHIIRIELPKSAKMQNLPEDVGLKCKHYADFSLKFEKDGKSIVIEESFRIKTRIIPAADYQSYKEFIIAAKQETEKRLFVKIKN